ncbi:pirin family protein [Uliginosibacterium sp. H3]|uniref:Pirin family protein n=1 Tax=Uliginosibacterium silvisoli TaxID=3114758 RepID=A0ABU6K575_9RHOO|nr:pirin family protein [Uliginosibacterium sp. H3]
MSSILHRITPHTRDIGFPVKRLLPDIKARSIGPFVFLDHMGPTSFAAGTTAGDVRPHPHIGLATITYLFSGAIMHRDSLGSVQRITPGDINWMTAGYGIVHSERIPDDVRDNQVNVEGLQMWVALPPELEECEPAFWHYAEAELPRYMQGDVNVHVMVGSFGGRTSPVRVASPTLYVALEIPAEASIDIPADYAERGLYVVSGAISIDGERVEQGTLVVLQGGSIVRIDAPEAARLVLIGGEALAGQRGLWWNFVSSDKARLEAAKQAWAQQDTSQFPKVPGEVEFIPLPER